MQTERHSLRRILSDLGRSFGIGLFLFTQASCIVATDVPRPAPQLSDEDYYGSAYYYADATEYIYDDYDYLQIAQCSGTVLFTGWFDHRCDALTESEPRYADLLCSYFDEFGGYYSYYESFYFPTGYITESCSASGGSLVNVAPSNSSSRGTPEIAPEIAIDPKVQPEIQDGRLQAVVTDRSTPYRVAQRLGKNIGLDEFLKGLPGGRLARYRDTTKPVERIMTRLEYNKNH